MTDDDALRARLAAADPAAGLVPPPLTDDRLERAMSSTVLTADPAVPPPAPSRRPWLAAAAAAVVLAGAGGAYVATRDDAPERIGNLALEGVLLTLPSGDPLFQSCLPLADQGSVLSALPTAFAGTVTSVSAGSVSLTVDRWYTADRGEQVVLGNAPADQQALLGAADFAVGQEYLVSAGADGVVSVCGLTGPASPELQAVYDGAF